MALTSKFYPRQFAPSAYVILRYYSQHPNEKNGSHGTVDKSEVNFHAGLSKEWWNEKDGPMKALHAMNKIRVQFIRSGLINTGKLKEAEANKNPLYLKGLSIADVGCGGGILSLNLARLGASVTGVEPSAELVDVARSAIKKFNPAGPAEFIVTSAEEYAKNKPNAHDAVICSEVIEHVTKKEEFVSALIKMLKPGGSVFFTTLNRTVPGRILTIFVAENILRLLPAGTHQYEKFITPDELSELLNKSGCETKMVSGFIYIPVSNSFCWIPSTAVQYALHAVKRG